MSKKSGWEKAVQEYRETATTAEDSLRAELAAANAEVERLTGLLSGEPKLVEMRFTPERGLTMDVQHWAVKLIAASVYDTFKESGGENYVTLTINPGDDKGGPLEVTIRPWWTSKKTPADVIAELRAENAELRAKVAPHPQTKTSEERARELVAGHPGDTSHLERAYAEHLFAAILAEREACARRVGETNPQLAAAIRARGNP